MFDLDNARLFARRKKYWVAALCTASFACGHYLFGDDDAQPTESLLSQYQQATQQLVGEVQVSSSRRPATKADTQTSRPQPTKAQAAVAVIASQNAVSSSSASQQKSSRRVKPTQQPASESSVAKAEPRANAEPPIQVANQPVFNEETHNDEQSVVKDQPSANKTDLAVQSLASPAVVESPLPATAEEKPLPAVAYVEIPRQTPPPQNTGMPRMEIITPSTASSESPRTQETTAQNIQSIAAKPVPMQAEAQLSMQSQPSQPLPQIINVSRQAVVPPQPPKLASTLAELNDEHLPPIVSPDQVPRPGTRKKPIQPAAQSTPVLRIDLSKK